MKKIRLFTAILVAVCLLVSACASGKKGNFGGNPPERPDGDMGFPGESSSSGTTVVVEGADSVTYTYKTAKGITKTYYAKYLVDGTTLDLTDETIEATSSNEIAVLVVNGGTANLTNCTIISNFSRASRPVSARQVSYPS